MCYRSFGETEQQKKVKSMTCSDHYTANIKINSAVSARPQDAEKAPRTCCIASLPSDSQRGFSYDPDNIFL